MKTTSTCDIMNINTPNYGKSVKTERLGELYGY